MKYLIKICMVISITCAITLISCIDKNQLLDNSQAIDPIWMYDFKIGLTGSMKPLINGNYILFSPKASNDALSGDRIIAIDKTSGESIWEWSDFILSSARMDSYFQKYFYNNLFAFAIGSRSFAIDLKNGKTLWKHQTITGKSDIVGIDNIIYNTDSFYSEEKGEYCDQIVEANINSGNWKTIFEVKGGDSLRQGLTIPAFYTTNTGDELLLMGNTTVYKIFDGEYPKGYATPHLIAYNKTKDTIEYTVQLFEPGLTNRVDWYPKVYNDKVYLTLSTGIACHDAATGERIWFVRTHGDFLFSGMLIGDNGYIYANRDGGDPTLYCIDPTNGHIVWEKASAGTASPIVYHEDVIYFVGGSTGKLHIVDANTGETLHLISAPSQYKNRNDFFNSAGCVIDTENDRLYVSSYSTAYCFPTIELK